MQNMSRSNEAGTDIQKMIVDETREVHKSSRLQMSFKIYVLKNFPIFTRNTCVAVSF